MTDSETIEKEEANPGLDLEQALAVMRRAWALLDDGKTDEASELLYHHAFYWPGPGE